MKKINLNKILPAAALLFALTAVFMIFAPSVVLKADGLDQISFTGLQTAFGGTLDGVQYFASSANAATYLLLAIGIAAIIFASFNKGGKLTIVLAVACFLVAAILFLSAVVLCKPQNGFTLLLAAAGGTFSTKSLHLGAGAVTGLVFSLCAAFSSAAYLLTDRAERHVFSTKWITYTAIMTALVVATGFIPPIPTPAGNVYWVDGVVLIAAFLLDPLAAFISGGIGSLLYDILKSPSMMLPSLLIHGLQGAVVSALLHFVVPNRFKKWEWVKALITSLAGAVIVVLGYFSYRCVLLGVPVAVTNIPRNVIQEVIGISIAMVLCYATTFKKQLKKNNLLPDFKNEVVKKKTAEAAPPVENNE
ncbi:MAG: ECF transporter S component [Clostridia bacterium]|nr:ECF transporter S component [Clostridia bacterium]